MTRNIQEVLGQGERLDSESTLLACRAAVMPRLAAMLVLCQLLVMALLPLLPCRSTCAVLLPCPAGAGAVGPCSHPPLLHPPGGPQR